jgi:hypothetical protein
MKRRINNKDQNRIGGFLTITTLRDGVPVRTTEAMPNKVVMSSGYGRNLLVRQLAGDATYSLEIDSASVGDDNTAAADAQTDLLNPLVEDIPITNKAAVDDDLTVDVFVADANLPDDTYEEFGLFCDGRLFARVVISPAYTKATGEDTLFTYELNLAG